MALPGRKVTTLTFILLLLSGCATPATTSPTAIVPTLATSPSTAQALAPTVVSAEIAATTENGHPQTIYPLTIENCGNTLTFAKPPERVVTLYPPTTEIMLKLGLKEQIVGAAFTASEDILPELVPDYRALNALSTTSMPSKEALFNVQPDFVFDNQPDYFYDRADAVATRSDLAAAGAQIYSLTAKCGGGVTTATIDMIYTDVLNIGKIFGVEPRAQAVVDEMKAGVADVQQRISGKPAVKVLIYDAGEGPLGIFGPGTFDYVLQLAGGENAFGDLPESYSQLSVEEVAVRDADVLVVPEYSDQNGNPTAQKRLDFLIRTFPNMTAVKNKRFVTLPYQNLNPSIQNALGVRALAEGLQPEAFK